MIEDKLQPKKPHNIILENRKILSVSGVQEIIKFDENIVIVNTSLGELSIIGERLHISKSSIETSELNLDGEIFEMVYSVKSKASSGIFSKWFK